MHTGAGVKNGESCIYTTKKNSVEMPVTNQVYQVLFENKKIKDTIKDLMQRDLKSEAS